VKAQRSILTASEVADYLRVHVMTVYRMVERGDLPAMRVSRNWRFRREQIDQWLIKNSNAAARPSRARR